MIAPDGRETARGASEYARLNIARVKSPGGRSKAACAPRFSGAQELPKRRCACALFLPYGACGLSSCPTRASVAVAQCARSGGFRAARARGGSSAESHRAIRAVRWRLGSPAAAHRRGDARGQRGPREKEKYSLAFRNSVGSLALGLSRAPIARARSRRARHRRAHAVWKTRTRDLRGHRCPREASRAVAPKRARSSTSSGAPGCAREGAREGGKHRKAGNLPGTHRGRKRGAPSPREPQTGLLEAVPQPSGYPLTVATLRGGFYPG